MTNQLARVPSLALVLALIDPALAQSPPSSAAFATVGTCVVVQTTSKTVEAPISLRAVGACEAGGDKNRSCTAELVPSGPQVILDMNDRDGESQCLGLTGYDPCAFVQYGPVIFQSERHATRSFSAASDRARITTMLRQRRIEQQSTDLPPSSRFPLNSGRLLDVLRSKSAVSARLECAMADGDQRIFPIVGEANLSPTIVFVSKNSSDPNFDVLTYRVTQ